MGLSPALIGGISPHGMDILRLFSFLALAGLLVPLSAVEKGPRPGPEADDPESVRRFAEGLELHQTGVEGDEDAVAQAIAIFEELQERHPDDARVQAFLGNLYTLRARDVIFFRKMRWLRKGLDTLDAAVAASPEDPHVRSVRAINSYRLPSMFGRRQVADEDFAVLLEWAVSDPDRFSDGLLRFVYFHAGCYYAEEGDSRAHDLFERAMDAPGDSVSDEKIRRKLSETGD